MMNEMLLLQPVALDGLLLHLDLYHYKHKSMHRSWKCVSKFTLKNSIIFSWWNFCLQYWKNWKSFYIAGNHKMYSEQLKYRQNYYHFIRLSLINAYDSGTSRYAKWRESTRTRDSQQMIFLLTEKVIDFRYLLFKNTRNIMSELFQAISWYFWMLEPPKIRIFIQDRLPQFSGLVPL